MRIFNLKEAARTLIFLKEQGIDSYDDLCKIVINARVELNDVSNQISKIETQQKEINELQKYIGQYGKTKEVYSQYRASRWSRKFPQNRTIKIGARRARKSATADSRRAKRGLGRMDFVHSSGGGLGGQPPTSGWSVRVDLSIMTAPPPAC